MKPDRHHRHEDKIIVRKSRAPGYSDEWLWVCDAHSCEAPFYARHGDTADWALAMYRVGIHVKLWHRAVHIPHDLR